MPKPRALVLSGYGLNCEEETALAFVRAGALADIVHINDLIARKRSLGDYRILAFPGGFAYGDDTGAGNAYANRLRNNLWGEVRKFVEEGNLVIGICNGFQILANLGLLPNFGNSYERKIALLHNDSARYTVRWVDLAFFGSSPWVKGLGAMALPIAHGEGRLYAEEGVLEEMNRKGMVAARYVKGEICETQGLKHNPNGSLQDIAAITDESGRVFGIMPHPERAQHFTNLPDWTLLREKARRRGGEELPKEGPGLRIFQNAVGYF
jgi:phosphoribosylformylglycinamidine synthase